MKNYNNKNNNHKNNKAPIPNVRAHCNSVEIWFKDVGKWKSSKNETQNHEQQQQQQKKKLNRTTVFKQNDEEWRKY